MDEPRPDRCETCRFWDAWADKNPGSIDGKCRRFPPQYPQTESQVKESNAIGSGSGLFTGFFPETWSHEWCGEWKAKDSQGEQSNGSEAKAG
jgi:hypothetical protein